MKQHANFITIATPDLDAARAFYCDGLGWSPTLDVPGEIIFVQIAPGLVLGLFDSEAFDSDLGDAATGAPVAGVTIAHNVDTRDEVDAAVTLMSSLGATVTTSPRDGEFGGIYHAHVRDPNGLIWEIAHNPGWHVDEDGTVSFD